MAMVLEQFDPKVHIAEFCFEQRVLWREKYIKTIVGNLRKETLQIEIWEFAGNKVATFEYSIGDKNKMNSLLPLVRRTNFENLKDFEPWSTPHQAGYRDGWFYRFVCTDETGVPIGGRCLEVLFEKGYEPADERLLRWIKNGYAHRKELEPYGSLW